MAVQRKPFLFSFFFLISLFAFSQTSVRKTDVNKDIDVVRVYEQVVKEGYGTPFIYKELATAYYYKNNYNKAVMWFQKLFSVENSGDPALLHQYKQSLKALAVVGKVEEAPVAIMR